MDLLQRYRGMPKGERLLAVRRMLHEVFDRLELQGEVPPDDLRQVAEGLVSKYEVRARPVRSTSRELSYPTSAPSESTK